MNGVTIHYTPPGSARLTELGPIWKNNVMKINTNNYGIRRRSYGDRALSATLSPDSHRERKGCIWRRGKRGGGRKYRAGARKQQKTERLLRKKNLLILSDTGTAAVHIKGAELWRNIYNFDVMLLQETNVKRVTCPEYKSYNNPTSSSHHGQTILVKDGIDHKLMDASPLNKEDREVQIIEVGAGCRKWVLVNVYIGNNSPTSASEWKYLDELNDLGERVLIIGDFNAKSSTSWGNENENPQRKGTRHRLR